MMAQRIIMKRKKNTKSLDQLSKVKEEARLNLVINTQMKRKKNTQKRTLIVLKIIIALGII